MIVNGNKDKSNTSLFDQNEGALYNQNGVAVTTESDDWTTIQGLMDEQ